MLGVTEADYVVVLVEIRASYIKSDLFALNTFKYLLHILLGLLLLESLSHCNSVYLQ